MPCQCILCGLFHFKYRFWISNSSFISLYKEKLQLHLLALASLTSYKHPQALDTTLIYKTGEPKVLLLYTPHLSSDRTYTGPSTTINTSNPATLGHMRLLQPCCHTHVFPQRERSGLGLMVRGSGKINPTSSMLIFTRKKKKPTHYQKEWCQICTNINNILPRAFILWKPHLLTETIPLIPSSGMFKTTNDRGQKTFLWAMRGNCTAQSVMLHFTYIFQKLGDLFCSGQCDYLHFKG